MNGQCPQGESRLWNGLRGALRLDNQIHVFLMVVITILFPLGEALLASVLTSALAANATPTLACSGPTAPPRSAESFELLDRKRFDQITKAVEHGALAVRGEKKITEKVEGQGGISTFCTLGEEMGMGRLLAGDKLLSFDELAKYVFYTAKKRLLVFAAAKSMSRRELTRQGLEFRQLPYTIHRIMGG